MPLAIKSISGSYSGGATAYTCPAGRVAKIELSYASATNLTVGVISISPSGTSVTAYIGPGGIISSTNGYVIAGVAIEETAS